MADDLKFANARFATFEMLPASDDEVTAVWGRKAAGASAKAFGEWATIVIGTSPNPPSSPGGAATIFFDSLGFSELPTIDLLHVRGGTEIWRPLPLIGESWGDLVSDGIEPVYNPTYANQSGRQFIFLYFNPDYHRDDTVSAFTVSNQDSFGTFLVRLRGN